MTLRRYQAESVEKTLAALERSGSAVLQMPTGAGKTKTATEIIANHDGVVWFLCHRKEIIRQAAKAFRASGIDFGVISPAKDPETEKKYRFEPEKRVQLASVGSIGRRIADLPSPSLVIWDECQHTPADSWRALRDKTLDAKHIGLTATPERLDGAGLRDLFDDMIVGPSIDELVADGYLSKYRYFAPSEPDLTAARMRGGDYRREDLDKVMNTPVLIGDAVAEYKKSVPGKRALVFAASVDASKALVERFVAEGIPAAHVDGDTPDDERDAAVAALASGDICVLSNVEVFTEGFDIPAIDAVILMRPTRSVRLLLQMIGRALRVADGKDGAMIFDHAGLYNEHGWFAEDWHWSLDGGAAKERRKALERGPRKCPECKEVRAEREPVCACGFEFPSGREIGEFDGVLREIRGEVPEGCETVNAFARALNVSEATIRNAWIPSGMPAKLLKYGSFIYSGPAREWVAANITEKTWWWARRRATTEACEPVKTFCKRHRIPTSPVKKWVQFNEFPINEIGQVITTQAEQWILINADLVEASQRRSVKKRAGFQTGHEFSIRHGFTSATVLANWKNEGLPSDGNMIPTIAGDRWVGDNQAIILKSRRQALAKNPPPGFITKAEMGKRCGAGELVIGRMVRKNLIPTVNGLIDSDFADAFIARYFDVETMRFKRSIFRKPNHPGFETQSEFGRRIGVKNNSVHFMVNKSGLPYDPKLGIPIREALEWVRDNRPDIVIPPEAWPSPAEPADNDNATASKAA